MEPCNGFQKLREAYSYTIHWTNDGRDPGDRQWLASLSPGDTIVLSLDTSVAMIDTVEQVRIDIHGDTLTT